MADLVFGDPPLGHSPDLVFGEDTVSEGTLVLTTVTGAFAALSFVALVGTVLEVSATGSFAPLTLDAQAGYVSNTQRPTVRLLELSFERATHGEVGLQSAVQQATALPATVRSPWQEATALSGSRTVLWRDARHKPHTARVMFEDGTKASVPTASTWQNASRAHMRAAVLMEDGTKVSSSSRLVWQEAQQLRRQVGVVLQNATGLRASLTESGGYATPMRAQNRVRFEEARKPPAGRRSGPEAPPNPSACYEPNTHLVFAAELVAEQVALDAHLLFFCENHLTPPPPGSKTVVVPVRRVYVVINNVSLHRINPDGSEGIAVPVFGFSLSLDASSWVWGFDALLPGQAQALVVGNSGGPVQLAARVNGTPFRVLAENISRERSFGDARIRISGRGHQALLAAPYAPVMNFSNAQSRTARQLMDDVLTINNVSLGWTVDWGLTDWNVPAGVFAQQGTWMEALVSIVSAAGGYLIPHPSNRSIRVRHRYPVAPWNWNTVTPDFVLPVDAVARESLRWVDKPTYNRVFVSGQDVGVLGQVTRAGTAGDVLAPMVVDPLITEAAAARQRGLAVLADTGTQVEVSLRLPVLAATGIIEPGAFVEYQDGSITRLGLVRSIQVEAGMPEVWQTLGVQGYA
jgi:hypothetical protein